MGAEKREKTKDQLKIKLLEYSQRKNRRGDDDSSFCTNSDSEDTDVQSLNNIDSSNMNVMPVRKVSDIPLDLLGNIKPRVGG